MTPKQKEQFDRMVRALQEISTVYMTPDQLRKQAPKEGLEFEEELEMAYENIQSLAAFAIKGVKGLK